MPPSSVGMISTFWFGAVASAFTASMYFSATRKFAAARSPRAIARSTSQAGTN